MVRAKPIKDNNINIGARYSHFIPFAFFGWYVDGCLFALLNPTMLNINPRINENRLRIAGIVGTIKMKRVTKNMTAEAFEEGGACKRRDCSLSFELVFIGVVCE